MLYNRTDHFKHWLSLLCDPLPPNLVSIYNLFMSEELRPKTVQEVRKWLYVNNIMQYQGYSATFLLLAENLHINQNLQKDLTQLFHHLDFYYELVRPKERTNFISFTFVLKKLLLHLYEPKIAALFPKASDLKRLQCENIWTRFLELFHKTNNLDWFYAKHNAMLHKIIFPQFKQQYRNKQIKVWLQNSFTINKNINDKIVKFV